MADSVAQDNTKNQVHYHIPETMPEGSFRAYDIRGEAGDEGITPNVAYAIGLSIASEVRLAGRQQIIVARDGRLTGPVLIQALITGLTEAGCDVIDIGIVPTPVLYFATFTMNVDSGVMVTASHNPGHHNGFKIVIAGKTLTTERIQELLQRILKRDFQQGRGKVTKRSIESSYSNYITKNIQLKKPLKIVVDCGNGVAGALAPRLYRALGCEVEELFCDIDGRFPNHHPDPSVPENLRELIARVKASGADVGLAFDGDADRLGVVTDAGEIIWPDRQMMLYAKEMLARCPGADIVFDVKCSSHLAKVIKQYGGNPVMYRTGHSILKAKMLEIGAPLAGEMSGHVFYQNGWFGFDDGIYVGARLLEIMAKQSQPLSALFAAFPHSVCTPELKLPMPEQQKSGVMQRLMKEADFAGGTLITIDGIRVEFAHGWGLVRPSNTSPYLILRFEAETQEQLTKIQDIFRRALLAIDDSLQLPF